MNQQKTKIILNDQRELEEKVTDVLYCRHLCKELGIDYSAPTAEDCMKARRYILERYEVKYDAKA